jgi:hypothetical protein
MWAKNNESILYRTGEVEQKAKQKEQSARKSGFFKVYAYLCLCVGVCMCVVSSVSSQKNMVTAFERDWSTYLFVIIILIGPKLVTIKPIIRRHCIARSQTARTAAEQSWRSVYCVRVSVYAYVWVGVLLIRYVCLVSLGNHRDKAVLHCMLLVCVSVCVHVCMCMFVLACCGRRCWWGSGRAGYHSR